CREGDILGRKGMEGRGTGGADERQSVRHALDRHFDGADEMSGAEEAPLLERREGGVVVLTMNVPDKRNALVPGIREGLLEALARLDEDRDCRAIVLTGAGSAFCAGGDISNPGPFTGPQVRMLMKRPQRLLRAIAGHS